MKITLRKKKNKKRISYFIDYYDKGNRQFEYLKLYLYPKPKDAFEKAENKRIEEIAKTIFAKRTIEYQGKRFDVKNVLSGDRSFIKYFEVLAEKRYDSPGNYGNWTGTLRHLKIYANPNLSFNDITYRWLEQFKDYLINTAVKKNKTPLSANTISSYYGKIRAALKEAVREGIIDKSPTDRVRAPKEAETRKEFLTLEELRIVAKAPCENTILKRAFLFSCLTGFRFSDVKRLRWDDIEHSEDVGLFIRFQQKKTQSYETLPIAQETFDLLEKGDSVDEFVFPDLVYSANNNTILRKWINGAGVKKYLTYHCSRHTYATLQLSSGTNIYTVSKLLGHKNLKTTQVYTKIIDQQKIEAANKIKL